MSQALFFKANLTFFSILLSMYDLQEKEVFNLKTFILENRDCLWALLFFGQKIKIKKKSGAILRWPKHNSAWKFHFGTRKLI